MPVRPGYSLLFSVYSFPFSFPLQFLFFGLCCFSRDFIICFVFPHRVTEGGWFYVFHHFVVIVDAIVADVVFNIMFIGYLILVYHFGAGCALFLLCAVGAVVAWHGLALFKAVDVVAVVAVFAGKVFVHGGWVGC